MKAFEIISAIMIEVKYFEEQVNSFKGVKNDKEYRYLEEMLTRCLLKLDNVESRSNETIRQARKQVVRCIEAAIKKTGVEDSCLRSWFWSWKWSRLLGWSWFSREPQCILADAGLQEHYNASSVDAGLQKHHNASSADACKFEEMNVDSTEQETPVDVDDRKREKWMLTVTGIFNLLRLSL
jgi:hypothetical protein